jgi:hypothetical protein
MQQAYLNLTFFCLLALDRGAVLGTTGVAGPSDADKLPSNPSLPRETIALAFTLAALGALRPSEEEGAAAGALRGGSAVEGVGKLVAVFVFVAAVVLLDDAVLEAAVGASSSPTTSSACCDCASASGALSVLSMVISWSSPLEATSPAGGAAAASPPLEGAASLPFSTMAAEGRAAAV